MTSPVIIVKAWLAAVSSAPSAWKKNSSASPPTRTKIGPPRKTLATSTITRGRYSAERTGATAAANAGPAVESHAARTRRAGQKRLQGVDQGRPPDDQADGHPQQRDPSAAASRGGRQDEPEGHEAEADGHDERRDPDGDEPDRSATGQSRRARTRGRRRLHGADGHRHERGARRSPTAAPFQESGRSRCSTTGGFFRAW